MDQEGKEEYTEFLNLIRIFVSMLSENGKLITKMGEIEEISERIQDDERVLSRET